MGTKLSDGTVIHIDEADIPLLEQADWRLDRRTRTPRIASVSGFVRIGRQRYVSLARLIARAPACRKVHYLNGDWLDLRRANLSFQATSSKVTRDKSRVRIVGVASGPPPSPDNDRERLEGAAGQSGKVGMPTQRATRKVERPPQNRLPRWATGTRNR